MSDIDHRQFIALIPILEMQTAQYLLLEQRVEVPNTGTNYWMNELGHLTLSQEITREKPKSLKTTELCKN